MISGTLGTSRPGRLSGVSAPPDIAPRLAENWTRKRTSTRALPQRAAACPAGTSDSLHSRALYLRGIHDIAEPGVDHLALHGRAAVGPVKQQLNRVRASYSLQRDTLGERPQSPSTLLTPVVVTGSCPLHE
jgi:hypothetical protein